MNRICFFASLVLAVMLSGCGKDRVVPVESIYATSEVKDFADAYASAHIMDATNACWCGLNDNGGMGEKFVISFKEPVVMSGFYLINGNASSFKEYNRVKRLTILTRENDKELKQDIELRDHEKIQHLILKEKITGKKVTFIIKEIYKGTKGKGVCVTELGFKQNMYKPVVKKLKNVKIKFKDFILTLADEGKISGYGDFHAKDCRQKLFSTGSWGFLQDGQLYIHLDCILFKKQGDCVDSCPECPARENKQFMFTFPSVADLMKYKVVEPK